MGYFVADRAQANQPETVKLWEKKESIGAYRRHLRQLIAGGELRRRRI